VLDVSIVAGVVDGMFAGSSSPAKDGGDDARLPASSVDDAADDRHVEHAVGRPAESGRS